MRNTLPGLPLKTVRRILGRKAWVWGYFIAHLLTYTHTHTHRPKDAVAAIRKRLTGNSKNFHIINLTLTVRYPLFPEI